MKSVGCIVVDFDGTLVYFRDYDPETKAYVELNRIFTDFGIPLEKVERVYDEVRDRGFSPERFAIALLDGGFSFELGDALERVVLWLEENLATYDDAREVMARWIDDGYEVLIVTSGESDWQRQKAWASKLPHSALFLTRTDEQKAGLIERVSETYGGVLVLDDKPEVLDALRDADPAGFVFATVRVLREESKYRDEQSRHKHLAVTSFTDPILYAVLA